MHQRLRETEIEHVVCNCFTVDLVQLLEGRISRRGETIASMGNHIRSRLVSITLKRVMALQSDYYDFHVQFCQEMPVYP